MAMFPFPISLSGSSASIVFTEEGKAASSGSATTIARTMGIGGIPAGSNIIVIAGGNSSGVITASCADTASNTYATDASDSTSGYSTFILSASNVNALVSTNTVTVTFSGACTDRAIIVCYATGLKTSGAIDQQSGTNGTSTNPAVTLSNNSQANELEIVYVYFDSSAAITATFGGGYSTIDNNNIGSGKSRAASNIVSSIVAGTTGITLDTSVLWSICAATYKSS